MSDRRYLKNPVASVLEIESLTEITPAFLSNVVDPSIKLPLSIRPKFVDESLLSSIVAAAGQSFGISMNFVREQSAQIRTSTASGDLVEVLKRHELSVEPLDTQSALVDEVLSTTDKYFVDVWRGRLDDAVINAPRAILPTYLSLDDTLRIADSSGNAVAIIAVAPSHDCLCRELNHVLWAWIDSSLPVEARRAIRSAISLWLERKSELVQGTIHLSNVASQRFAKAAGFELKCLHVRKL